MNAQGKPYHSVQVVFREMSFYFIVLFYYPRGVIPCWQPHQEAPRVFFDVVGGGNLRTRRKPIGRLYKLHPEFVYLFISNKKTDIYTN